VWEESFFFEAACMPGGRLQATIEMEVWGQGLTSDTLIGRWGPERKERGAEDSEPGLPPQSRVAHTLAPL
jgi:hypothetical protein